MSLAKHQQKKRDEGEEKRQQEMRGKRKEATCERPEAKRING
jgi:hypothetical protein